MQKRPRRSTSTRSIVRDHHVTLPSFFSQINDVPVTHICDIEPLVYESVTTIKFLVARPAQEVGLEENVFYSRNGNMHVWGVVTLHVRHHLLRVYLSRISREWCSQSAGSRVVPQLTQVGSALDDKNGNNLKQNVGVSKVLKISQIAQIC